MNDQTLYQLALLFVPQVGAVTAKMLVSFCGSAEGVFRATHREILKIPGVGPTTAHGIRSAGALEQAERELAWMEQHDIGMFFYTDSRYPARLRQNADCPVLLFYKGSDPDLLNAPRIVAIVGTRQPTPYGKAQCEEFVQGLHDWNCTLVSGLAYGIDVTAHRQANALRMPNIGVLGHGLGMIYPNTHRNVALQMIENGGILSEYPFAKGPDREHFPMRNRIIAGMADALLVVETAEMGGSMITAELANQYERDIFALPGRKGDPKSAGCNLLIKNNRAKLVESAQDIANFLRWDEADKRQGIQTRLFEELSPLESQLVDAIRQQPEIPIDALTLRLGLPPGEMASILLDLEFKGLVRTLPGKRYMLGG